MNYKCEECGANLDPGEVCDCTKEKDCQRTTDDSPRKGKKPYTENRIAQRNGFVKCESLQKMQEV